MRGCRALIFVLLICSKTIVAQSPVPPVAFTDSLISHYLSDTTNAVGKIKELTNAGNELKDKGDRLKAISMYQIALSLVPYAEDSFIVISRLYANFAGLLGNSKATDLSLVYFKKALDYQRKSNPAADSRAYNIIGNLAGYYFVSSQFDSAKYYYQLQALEAKGTATALWIAGAYNNTGMLYFQHNNLPVARAYYDSASNALHLNEQGNLFLLSSIRDNQAQLELREKNYAASLNLYAQNLKYYNGNKDSANAIKTLEGRLNVFIAQKKPDAALQVLEQIKKYPLVNTGKYTISYTLKWFELQKDYYQLSGNWPELNKVQNQQAEFKDSLQATFTKERSESVKSIAASEIYRVNTSLSLYQLQLKQRETDLRWTRYGLAGAVLLILLIVLLLIMVYVNFRNRNRLQQQEIGMQVVAKQLAEANLKNQQLEKERIARELDFKNKDLSDLALYVGKLKEMYDLMVVKLNQIKRKRNADHKQELTDLATEIDALVQSQEKVSLIQENVGQINKEFMGILLNRFPTLTKSELELCSLFRLNMSNKEIGSLKGISAESVKMSRYRLRKKLGLSPEEDIYRFLSAL